MRGQITEGARHSQAQRKNLPVENFAAMTNDTSGQNFALRVCSDAWPSAALDRDDGWQVFQPSKAWSE
jgi:hypothetical protein